MLAICRNILILFSVGLIVILVGCSSSPSNQTTAIETETEMDHEFNPGDILKFGFNVFTDPPDTYWKIHEKSV